MTPAEAVLDDPVDTEVIENESPELNTPETAAPEAVPAQPQAEVSQPDAPNPEELTGQLSQLREYALQQHRELEQLRYQQQQWEQHLAQQRQAAQPPPAAPAPLWNPPALSDISRRYIGPDGRPIENAPVAARNEIDAYNTYRANWVEKLTHNPGEALAPFIQQEAQKIVEQQLAQQIGQIQSAQFTQTYLSENADWAYEKGPDGRPLFNPLTGQGVPSAYGRRLGEILNDIASTFPGANERDALRFGERLLSLELQAHGNQQQAVQAQAVDTRQQFLRDAATRTPNRSGSIPKTNDAPAQNGLQSLRQMLVQDFKEAGL